MRLFIKNTILLRLTAGFGLAVLFTFLGYSQELKPGASKWSAVYLFHLSTSAGDTIFPLEKVAIANPFGRKIIVRDGAGRVYVNSKSSPLVQFTVGGALGYHLVQIAGQQRRKLQQYRFYVDAKTKIDDKGYYRDMFNLFYSGMWDNGKVGSVRWNGKLYHFFVPWGLDHNYTMEGLKYFSPYGAEYVDLCRQAQREDGMIWSFIQSPEKAAYWLTRDKKSGYSRKIGDKVFTRQPPENHNEYIFVNSIYQCWQATDDINWIRHNLASAAKALDYSINDPARYSTRYGLLKRIYTIDSWDFAVEDRYTPNLGITNSMMIDPVKSKFGVFFGDNTGYITACNELAEMYDQVADSVSAKKYRSRAAQMKQLLDALAWNGRFFTHFIEEDSNVKRDLGVNERSQLAQSNAYSLNRDISQQQKKAIIESYLQLKSKLPVGSPGEWYSIYPPFQKGFGPHNGMWQYMNGGVGGHVAGELAKGAYENGYEYYATDILNRLFELGKRYDHKIYFSYTGATTPLVPGTFKTVDLRDYVNLSYQAEAKNPATSWMLSARSGDDFKNLPAGRQTLADIPFNIIAPETNNHKAVVAVSHRPGFRATAEITIEDTAACIYLLHTATKPSSENVAGNLTFVYSDGSRYTNYLIYGKQLTYWWFPELKTDYSGIAWRGKNEVSEEIGLSWCAINNPQPGKKISRLIFDAPADSTIYALFAISLADRIHPVPVSPVSFGGPDKWASATALSALIEGLAGIKNSPGSAAFKAPIVSPRWITTPAHNVAVSVRYAASNGYVAYQYQNDPQHRQIELISTGSGQLQHYHLEVPSRPRLVTVDKKRIKFLTIKSANTYYADWNFTSYSPAKIVVRY